jgi:hypothetical protein
MRSWPISVVAGLFVATASAQTTHLVGPGGFPQIRDALGVAAPGDIVAVQPGTYAHFTANLGVTIRAVAIGTVLVEYDPAFASGCTGNCGPTRIAVPAGQVVRCIGLDFRPNWSFSYVHYVAVTSGTATFERCTLRAEPWFALHVDGARVHLQDCTLASLGTGSSFGGLFANASSVTAVRCSFAGSSATLVVPGPAVRLWSSDFQGSQLQLTGGAILFGGPGGPGIQLDTASSAWISDSTITGGGTGCPVQVGGGAGRLDRCVLSPVGAACTSLPGGLVVGADSTTPMQIGAPFTIDWRTDPNQFLLVIVSPGLGFVPLPGLTDQPLSLDLANSWLATVLLSDAIGFATVTWNIPPGVNANSSLFVVGAGLTPAAFALSPSIGGVVF